ncbi:MAG: hypothetical protein JWO82_1969 [Akkermansiaceae bacterium]|nr:hypothetical protein [Akkermansiaceae bacterium]
MTRPVRISLSLLVSSTVMWFLIAQRLQAAAGLSTVAKENETRMCFLGMGIAGLLLIAGLIVMGRALIQSRKARALHG